MGDVSASNFVVEEVNNTPWVQFVIWAVDCVEGTLDEVVIVIGKVWDINVSVLEPILIYMKRMEIEATRYEDKIQEERFLQSIFRLTKCREPTRH